MYYHIFVYGRWCKYPSLVPPTPHTLYRTIWFQVQMGTSRCSDSYRQPLSPLYRSPAHWKPLNSLPPHTQMPFSHTSSSPMSLLWRHQRLVLCSAYWALSPFNLWVIMVFTNIRNPLISNHQALFKSLPDCGTPLRKILRLSLSPSHSLMTLHALHTHHLPPNNQ